MNILPIKQEADYTEALAAIEALFGGALKTEEADRLEVLVTLVEAYEDQHFSIPAPDPIEAIKYVMESRGLTRKDLEAYIGNRSRVSEILNRKRPLTLQMIQKLHRDFGITAEVLLSPYEIHNTNTAKGSRDTAHQPVTRVRSVHEKQHPFKKPGN